ncbi:FecCD family ABC transporter permease [Actinomyces capricornis]|uniref:ABC transporter permease n=1 Tax=Actinomyces capricornis TaxID=2755559 RepID=A0ABM7UA57_9ACTO|nr:iron ABC transporter permease [Actinomyces capricornis]BDA64246.1 ABC transporter permease [Actinomyces capricornis]
MSATALAPGFTRAGQRRRARRYLLVVALLALAVVVLWWTSLIIGETWYSPGEILAVMRGESVPGASYAVGRRRLPHAIIAALVGIAFGMSGTTSQTMLRNPLASPDIIGITSGASASAVFAILVLNWSGPRVTALAIACGLGTAALIYVLSGSGGSQGGRLILIGIGVSAMLTSVIGYLQQRASIYDVADAMRWLSGSLASTSWDQVPLLTGAVAACGAILLALGRDLGPLTLGEEAATGLGVAVVRTRLLLIVTMVALASFATATTGPIAFVSFLAGPIAARLVGRTSRTLLIPAALTGALIVLGGDLVAQHLLPTRLPVGVVTGIVGAPYLIIQLLRINRQGASA